MGSCISMDRILQKLDTYLNQNNSEAALRHLLYWLAEAEASQDDRSALTLRNELMGLYRKGGKRAEAIECAEAALGLVVTLGIGHQVGAATTYLNTATVYKAFGMAEHALPYYENARKIYEAELPPNDSRLGGLYNNMALALTDLARFEEAKRCYLRAIDVMEKVEGGAPELAVTYLNLASAAEAELGLVEADELIADYLRAAQILLDGHERRDGAYAFVCEKCASVFGYYGHFLYEKELKERTRRIYES